MHLSFARPRRAERRNTEDNSPGMHSCAFLESWLYLQATETTHLRHFQLEALEQLGQLHVRPDPQPVVDVVIRTLCTHDANGHV